MFKNPWPPLNQTDIFKIPIMPIAPYNNTTVEDIICDPFRRLAWVVPVRGRPPWGATPAAMLAGPSSQVTCDDHTLAWTTDTLRDFWGFLKDLKDAGNLGPLSVAFHCAKIGRAHV